MFQTTQLLLFGLMAAAGNLLGGWLIARSEVTAQDRLKKLLALGAGYMLAAVILEALPEIFQHSGNSAFIWLLAGYLIIQFAEHAIAPHFHFGEEVHHEEMQRHGVALTAVFALGIHAFFDGVTIASGLLISFRLGLILFIAVLLHKVPEGFTVASIMLSAGRTRKAAIQATLLIATATFAGIFSVALIQNAIQYALPLSAGATIYIAASDLIPEVNRERGWKPSFLIFLGVALFAVTHYFLHAFLP